MPEKKDTLVYIKHPKYSWVPAKLDRQEGDKAYVTVPQYKDQQSIVSDGGKSAKKSIEEVVDLNNYPHKVLPLQNVDANGNLTEFPDMVQLSYLHEAGILYNLKSRHKTGKPYTRTGDIIIAVNPFQWFTELYTEQKRIYYSNKLVWKAEGQRDAREGLEPHVYEVSALSYKGLAFDGNDQSILVSGESGAGKTETVKICMNHMASVQSGPTSAVGDALDPVVQKVVDSNPLLEAFGNAKTRRNDNSSRFGKYLQLQFDNSQASLMAFGDKTESKCKLAGSKCDVYLLEKPRVVTHDSEERTFHIFYQLLAATDAEKSKHWSGLAGKSNKDFKYVGNTNTTKIEGMTDAQHYEHTVKTLDLIGVNGEKLTNLMRAIAMVMQCGNLTFDAKDGDKDKSMVTSKDVLNGLADLVGVTEDVLSLTFTERTMKTRTETYKVPLTAAAAKDAADALAKEVYGNLFLWLVKQINASTCAEDNYTGGAQEFGLIGLLDIFGFESFPINRFEQLCINYANEKLQQKFTEDIFRSVQEEYESEGIELAEIWYDDNTDVLDLIEGRGGLLAMLNEECVRPGGNDQEFVQKALQGNKNSPCLIVNKLSRMAFGIHHYAGKVMYDADQFVASNTDTLPTDLSDLCAKSSNYIIAYAQEEVEAPSSGRRAPKRQKSNIAAATSWTKYKGQLSSLMTNLRRTHSRYIRCIKPNMAKKPVLMDHLPTVEQLRCAGVVAAVTLSRSAFPNRLDNAVCRYRYSSMWDNKAFPSKKTDDMSPTEGLRADCDALLTCALKCKETEDKGKISKAFVVGKTRCYFRAGALEYLEANRMENGLDAPATQIQKVARGYIIRKTWDDRVNNNKEAERKAAEEAARKAQEARLREEAARRKKAAAEAKRKKEEEARKAAEAERQRKTQEEADQKRREEEERRALQREEEEAQIALKKLQKKIKKLTKELKEKEEENAEKIKEAQDECDAVEAQKDELQRKYDLLLDQASKTEEGEIAANKKKIEESEKIVGYLRKENKKVRDKTEEMKEEMKEMKEQNTRLIEANASAGASLDSMDKQKKNLAEHNAKLDDNLKKWKAQNVQLKSDLANRTSYFKAETKIRAHYEKAMEEIIEILESRCDDADLVEEVTAAQLQCEALAAHKSAPAMAESEVSDF